MNEPTIYPALAWWKENIGFTNPNWNITFHKLYSQWFCDQLLSNNNNTSAEFSSNFLNDFNTYIKSYYFSHYFTDDEQWVMEITFILTCFYFVYDYHNYIFSN